MRVTTRATRYEVTALPDDVVNDRSGLVINVESRGKGRWAVVRDGRCWDHVTRTWSYEGLPSGQEDDWLAAHRYDSLPAALNDAVALAPFLTVNGWTVEQAIRMERGEKLCGEPIQRGIRCDLTKDHSGGHRP